MLKSKTKSRMRLLKQLRKLLNANRLIALLALMTILSGCKTPSVQTAIYDSFCEGKYKPAKLTKKNLKNLSQMRQSYRETTEEIIKYITLNEKEFKACPKSK